MAEKLVHIPYKPGRRIEFRDGEWVITEHGKIIARDLMISDAQFERLKAAVQKRLDNLDATC